MKKLLLILLSCVGIAACQNTDTGATSDGEIISVERNRAISDVVAEESIINLVDFISVSGGTAPYRYSTALQDEMSMDLLRSTNAYVKGDEVQKFGIYVEDSQGNKTKKPFVLNLTIEQLGTPPDESAVAFPGAGGGGRFASGGRAGSVVYVTNLNDGYPIAPIGSFRWALQQPSPKTIMFKVSGIIELKQKLYIRNDGGGGIAKGRGRDITIAGESAPGDGISIKNWPISLSNADNVIIRFIRSRLGDDIDTGGAQDAFEGLANKNVIIDHCSMAWSVDECSSWYRNQNFTLQWCILTESLRMSKHEKGTPHGYGAIWGGKDASFHHNLLASHDSRNPRFDGLSSYPASYPASEWRGNVDFRNNVIYNWCGEVSYGGEGGKFNMVGNYYKESPQSPARNRFFTAYAAAPDDTPEISDNPTYPTMYMSANYYVSKNGSPLTSIISNNYSGIIWNSAGATPTPPANAEFTITGVTGSAHTITHTAPQAFDLVVSSAGAWPRDKVDNRAATITANGTSLTEHYVAGYLPVPTKTGTIDSPYQVGGYPAYGSDTAPEDSDGDGIADSWETTKGLDPNDVTDGRAYTLSKIYTNLEVYLHSLAEKILSDKSVNLK